jgi:hypothetical protein
MKIKLTEIVERFPYLIGAKAKSNVVGYVQRRKLHELKVPIR